jgi:porin
MGAAANRHSVRRASSPHRATVCAAALLLGLAAAPDVAAGDYGFGSPRLLGDPRGVRSRLERLGVGAQLFYNQFIGGNPAGGAEPGSFGHSGSYDLFLRVDAEELIDWPDATALLHVKGQYDRNINADVGSLSAPIDDADFDDAAYVDELWIEQGILRERVRLRLGLLEQQTAFDRNAYANTEDLQFLTTFLDNNPTVPLPNGLGAVLFLRPARWLTLAAGVADADNVPGSAGFDTGFDSVDSLTGHLEAAFTTRFPGPGGRPLAGTYRVGAFLDGRDRLVFGEGRKERGHVGIYASFDQQLLRRGQKGDRGLGAFARVGWADPEVNRIEWFWSLGGQYQGLIPRRAGDVLGLGVYQAIGSSRYRSREDPEFDTETGFELYYKAEVLPWLSVTPDLQFIIDPGARGENSDAWVTTLRFRVTF